MKKSGKLNSTLVAATLCVVSAGWMAAQAQDVTSTPNQPPIQQPSDTTAAAAQPQSSSRCSQLIGTKVENQQGEKLGRITDVVVGFDNDHASYCVMRVKHGKFAKGRLVEVPLAAFQRSADGSCLILNASKANLANAQGFDPNQWPAAGNVVWGAEPAPPVQLPPSEVNAPQITETPAYVGPRPVIDSSYNWDQFPCPRTASQAIDLAHYESFSSYPISSH